MKSVKNFVSKYNLGNLEGYNTSNDKWKDGVDYWFYLDTPIPCTYYNGEINVNAYCDMINIFHPTEGDNSGKDYMVALFGLKKDENEEVDDVNKYILAESKDIKNGECVELLSLDNLGKLEIGKIEKFFFKKTYEQHHNITKVLEV